MTAEEERKRVAGASAVIDRRYSLAPDALYVGPQGIV